MLRNFALFSILILCTAALAHDSHGITIKIVHAEKVTAVSVAGQSTDLEGESPQEFTENHLQAKLNGQPWKAPKGTVIEDKEAGRFVWQTTIPDPEAKFEVTESLIEDHDDIPTTVQEYRNSKLSHEYSYGQPHVHQPEPKPDSGTALPGETIFLAATVGLVAYGIHRSFTLRKAAQESLANRP